jgi:adenosylcobinamide-phosphate synthase
MKIEFVEILMHPATILTFIFGLDLLFGDPVYRLHPVRLIGKLLTCYENRLRKIGLDGKFGGILLVLLLLASSLVIAWGVFLLAGVTALEFRLALVGLPWLEFPRIR